MKKSQAWVSFALALAIIANTLAPAAALAANGKPIRPIDNDDPPPMPQVDETGDPAPDPNGLNINLGSYGAWREALVYALRSQFAYLSSLRSFPVARDRAARISTRLGGRK